MRQRRAKIYRKMLHQYQLQFSFREPYQLLIDDTFSLALSRYKISDPLNQFGNVLQSKKIKPLITQCCMQALYGLGKEHQGTVNMAKEWERRMCNHREAIDPQECVKQCVGKENKHRYIVASEQGELRRDLRLEVPGVPMMHFTQAVMVLEPMSPLTKGKIEEKEETKLSLPASEAGLLKNQPKVDVDIIDGADGETEGEGKAEGEEGEKEESSSRRRKRKAPNPLSVRKSKNPRLTMEEKLKKEQEYKKQKQRNAAKARIEASTLNGSKSEQGASNASTGRKRKRSGTGKDNNEAETGKAAPALKPVAQVENVKEAKGTTQTSSADASTEVKKRKTQRSKRPSNAANGTSAESATAQSSA